MTNTGFKITLLPDLTGKLHILSNFRSLRRSNLNYTFKHLVPDCADVFVHPGYPDILLESTEADITRLWLVHTKIIFVTDWLQTAFQLASD